MMMGTRYGWCLSLVLCVALVGCGGGGGSKNEGGKLPRRVMQPPKAPPAVPPQVDTPINAQLQSQAKAELVRGAQSPTPLIRAHALELMRDANLDDAGPYVTRGLDDEAPVVRFAAAMAAGELSIADAKDRLRQLATDDPDSSIQIAARFALHKLGDTRLSHDLEQTAQSLDPRTRADTAMVFGLLGEKSALNVLRAMRNDPDISVRLQVAEAMWRLGDKDALTPLVGGTLSQFPDDQMTSLMGLASAGDRRVIEHLRGALTSDYEAISVVAARAMGKLNSDEGLGVALKAAKSNDPKLRLLAALALGDIGRTDSQDELQTLLRDTNADVRLAAGSAILELKSGRDG